MRQLTAAVIGAGLRGDVYASYSLDHPDELKIVAVAEPDQERREAFARKYHLNKNMCFSDYKNLLQREKMADFVMICTMDRMHYEPVIMALKKGYHVLCEKPMSTNESEIVRMGTMAEKYGRILSICHVLRYSPFFTKIKELIQTGTIGELQTIQQIEEVGFWHHAHSFVRGNWRKTEEASPMILQKCCHDMDILLWLVEQNCTEIQSFGTLSYFNKENAPKGSTKYCMDGCTQRDKCPFYAPRFYLEHPRAEIDGLTHAVSVKTDRESILKALQHGPYGRCVFHCDNTVVDHQVVNIQFEKGMTASFTMSAFTNDCTRKINVMGTRGQIEGDMEKGILKTVDFVTGDTDTIELHTPVKGHSGSDSKMVADFLRQISADHSGNGRSSATSSVDSHLMALAAEKSRLENRVISLSIYKEEIAGKSR
ncbi:MAG: Gfo/Idh/MocA family oxidoreductase [Eubacterium sp.]|nr:Gfo/Idh/MocA family oxidoreductase [Eubacterium sp.]